MTKMKQAGYVKKRKSMKRTKALRLIVIMVIAVSMMASPLMAFAADGPDDTTQDQTQDQTQEPSTQPEEPVKTTITGLPQKMSKKSRSVLTVAITIAAPAGRDLYVEQYKNKRWKTKKTIKTEDTTETREMQVQFPNTWWTAEKTKWRLRVTESSKATACKTNMMTLKTKRYYQNPKGYLQLTNKISKHGKHYYTYPVKVNNASTRKDHVKAMIKAARKYLGDPYIVCRSGKPGRGVDCSGLVMQACYAAGADLWPSNPYRHKFPKYEYQSRRIAKMKKLKTVSWKNRKKGDLIFYSKHGVVIHIAIYIGKGKIIHSWPGRVQISRARNSHYGHLCKVKRVFL